MRITIARDALADAVAWSTRSLPTRPSLPVLAGVVLEVGKDSLSLSSFDYEVSSRVVVDARVDAQGQVLVSGRLLADIARALPDYPISIEDDGPRVSITCGRSSFTLPTLPIDDYPDLPQMPETTGSIDATNFAEAVAQVAIAAGRDDTLPTLTGVRVEVDGSRLVLVATDRYRLAVRELDWDPIDSSIERELLIPARTIADVAKSLSDKSVVSMALNVQSENLVGFESESRRTTTRVLDGEFPKYRSLLPNDSSTHAAIDRVGLIDAVKRVALVAERTTPIRLSFAEGEVSLRAGAGDDARAEEAVEASISGDDIEIAFNPGYLLDGLSALQTATAAFAFTQPTRPAVLTQVGDDGDDHEYQYLLMPVRLTG